MRSWTRAFGTTRRAPALPTSSVGAAVAVAVGRLPATRPWYTDVWIQMLRRKPLGTIGGVIVVVMLAAAVLADLITPYGFAQTSLRARFVVTSGAHWLGTDQLGRDLMWSHLPGLFFVGRFFITVSISVLLMVLLRLSVSPWFILEGYTF